MSKILTIIFFSLTIYFYNQSSDWEEKAKSNERNMNYYHNLWTESVEQYDDLKYKTECFTDGYTDWKDCVSDL